MFVSVKAFLCLKIILLFLTLKEFFFLYTNIYRIRNLHLHFLYPAQGLLYVYAVWVHFLCDMEVLNFLVRYRNSVLKREDFLHVRCRHRCPFLSRCCPGTFGGTVSISGVVCTSGSIC